MAAQLLLAIKNDAEQNASTDGELENALYKQAIENNTIWHEPFCYSNTAQLSEYLNKLGRSELLNLMVVAVITKEGFCVPNHVLKEARRLVLEFPEVYWVFAYKDDDNDKMISYSIPNLIKQYHLCSASEAIKSLPERVKWHSGGFRTLFDPTGLRSWVRDAGGETDSQTICTGVSVEDELDYCYFNAYVMFMRGLHVFTVNTLVEMIRLKEYAGGMHACIEDLMLNFPDAENNNTFGLLPVLEKGNFKLSKDRLASCVKGKVIMITSSPNDVKRGEVCQDKIDKVHKPYQGMYDEKLLLLLEDLSKASEPAQSESDTDNHGVDGLRQTIAESLVESCRTMLFSGSMEAYGTVHAVHAAVLASEARYLLDDKSKMLNLTALDLQQQAEILAEVNFVGVSTLESLQTRITHLTREVGKLWEGESKEITKQKLMSITEIYESIHRIYIYYGKFDEDIFLSHKIFTCYLEAKYLHSIPLKKEGIENEKIKYVWYRMKCYSQSWYQHSAYRILEYCGTVSRDAGKLFLCSLLWIVVFACLYHFFFPKIIANAAHTHVSQSWLAWWDAWLEAAYLFFTLSLPAGIGNITRPSSLLFIQLLNAITGAVHIGLYLAYLFGKLSRK